MDNLKFKIWKATNEMTNAEIAEQTGVCIRTMGKYAEFNCYPKPFVRKLAGISKIPMTQAQYEQTAHLLSPQQDGRVKIIEG